MTDGTILFLSMVALLYVVGSVRRRPFRRVKKRLEWWDF